MHTTVYTQNNKNDDTIPDVSGTIPLLERFG
jgi:hypothetical protein